MIENVVDSVFGPSCFCYPSIRCEIPKEGNIILKILRSRSIFQLEIESNDYSEKIDIIPHDELDGFIKHSITSKRYDEKTCKYEYKKYAGIFNGADKGENKDKLQVFLKEENRGNPLVIYNEFVQKIGDDHSTEALKQKGYLMQQLDPDMVNKIEELKKVLSIGDVSLLDNLISVCYDRYNDEELKALLGIKRQRMNYQDGADNLVNSYYGIGKNSSFFPLEDQKSYLKNK